VLSSVLIAGRRRSYVTLPDYRLGMKPANAGKTYPAEVLTRAEIHQLMAALGRGNAGARNRALVVVLWRCGLRVAEALALYPKDLDLDRGTVTVLHGKGDRRRVVGIDPEAAAVVEKWLARRSRLGVNGRHPVFCVISAPTLGKAMYSSAVRESLKHAGVKAGLDKRVHPHGLRHTYASELAREGVGVNVIQKLLGHNDLATTARYLDHLTPWEAIDIARGRTWAPLASGPVVPA
jgi:site-specific recombinase XerD